MVQIGDLEVQLVDAETKRPFKEHSKGKIYVEVEPDVEYFISIRKLNVTRDVLYCDLYVDEKFLGYYLSYKPHRVYGKPHYAGLWSYANRVSTMKALKFQKPKLTECSGSSNISPIMMGEVKIDVFSGVYKGHQERYQVDISDFATASVDRNAKDKKKNLRSGGGKVTDSNNLPATDAVYGRGLKLYSIVLNYCAAPGLVLCGVLPKPPDRWEHHRMLYPAEPAASNKRMRLVPSRTEDGKHELFDLFTLESDDGEDDYVEDENDKNKVNGTNATLQQQQQQQQQPEETCSDVNVQPCSCT